MEKLTVTQNYFSLVIEDSTRKSLSSSTKSGIGLIIANTLDLVFEQSVSLDEQDYLVDNMLESHQDQPYLIPVYNAIVEKSPMKTSRLVSRYAQAIKNQLTEIFQLTGDSLAVSGQVVKKDRKQLFKSSNYYEVNPHFLNQQVEQVKKLVTQQWDDKNAALMMLLKESKLLKQYLTKEEIFEVKEKLKLFQCLPEVKLVKKMMNDFVNQMDAAIVL
jgi:Mg2+/Co2+ transporter CorC